MKLLLYCDEQGRFHHTTKAKENEDGTLALSYVFKGKTHNKKKVQSKEHAIMKPSNPKDKKKTMATCYYKLVERPDPEENDA